MQLPMIRELNNRLLKEFHSLRKLFVLNQNLPVHRGNHRVLHACSFERDKFTFGSVKIALAHQRRYESITRCSFRRIFAFFQCRFKKCHCRFRLADIAAQQRANVVKIGAFARQLELAASGACAGVANALHGHRVGAHVAGHDTGVGNRTVALQALHERSHRTRIKLRTGQILETDAISLAFVFARKVEVALYLRGLRPEQYALRCVALAGLRREHRRSQSRDTHPRVFALVVHHARVVLLRDVRHLMRKHAGEFAFGLCDEHEPHIDADVTTGHRKRVDAGISHRKKFKLVANARVGVQDARAQFVQVSVDLRILQIRTTRSQFAHCLHPEFFLGLTRHQHAGAVTQFGQTVLGARQSRQQQRERCQRRDHRARCRFTAQTR